MFCAEYDLPSYRGDYTAEGDQRGEWSTKTTDSIRNLSLEDEILMLRKKMEQIFLQEQSFTSEIVIEISSLLDLKINEYMKLCPKKNKA
ncbi:aspartyl-phosphate phosphatase Spo0E family protein [Paenibacillus chibensis]|uniref:Aspartyl-phosphate phosphatase Spo0E family protein n=1 Tax=Paenibacillus chibensis TaxID=59846 RepID=A0ABU6PY85_9BACL|nr:aspartyl-phosphate phosphatase Spo0E family protein [Paenibacillus chibensis]MEC0368761.1 aspartyl-phosphate phosphatase Spo0E family protein [Paenibacillus chibensis]MED5019055.1 aspartyl-phosphate phosphatase Spo0E family protein [Paenibacillus chibensis]